MTTKTNLPVSSRVFNLLYAFDIDGRTGESNHFTPIAVLTGTDESPIPPSLYKAVLKKYLAQGDSSKYATTEQLINNELNEFGGDDIWNTPDDFTITIQSEFFTRQRIDVPESILTEYSGDSFPSELIVHYNKEDVNHNIYEVRTSEEDLFDSEMVPVVDANSESSPFMEPSPFVVKNDNIYLADKENNAIGNPYIRVIDAFGGPYMVMRKTGAGIVSKCGEEITPCIYQRIGLEPGNIISFDLDGLTGFYIPQNGILCPPKFRDIDFGDGTEPIKVLMDNGWGYLDENLKFYPYETLENSDSNDVRLL